MKASEYMAWLEGQDPKHVAGRQYCLNLYALAESIKATRILEFGTGWGWSGTAFSASVSNRSGSVVSVDSKDRMDDPCRDFLEGVDCFRAERSNTAEVALEGPFDLVYLDADPAIDAMIEDYKKTWPLLRPGGLLVVDGMFGQHGPSVFWNKVGLSCTPIQYSDGYAHGVHRKKPWPKHKRVTSVFCTECRWESKDRDEGVVMEHVSQHVITTEHTVKSSALTGGGYSGEGTRMTWGAR